jgi:hypothetical protein
MGYELDGQDYSQQVKDFSLLHIIQTESGTQPAFYPMGTRGSFPGGKAARV